jgi:ABC-type multidrug transport system fused ATPase/permease subunit
MYVSISASVDHTTDTFIQSMLRSRFQNTTLLTVAHRLNTIMDYDAVLVLDQGRCIEFGSPKRLLENPNGTFTAFVDATGPESAAELRDIAFKTISSFP